MQFAAFWLSTLGLRHSEIIGLQFKNIFQDHIEVRRTRTPHALDGNTTKTKSSVRDIPITLQTFNIISQSMYFSKKICQENNVECNADTYLIITPEAKPIPYGTLNYYFQKVSRLIDFHIFPI